MAPFAEPPFAHHESLHSELCRHGGQDRRTHRQQGRPARPASPAAPGGLAGRVRASWSASSSTWRRGQLDLVDLAGPGRGSPSGPGRGQAGQGAHGAPAHHGSIGDTPVARDGAGDRRHRLRGPGPQRDLIGHRQGVTGTELAAQAGGADGRARGHHQVMRVPHGGFEAPAAEVESEGRSRPRPHPGALPDEAQSRLFLSPRGRAPWSPPPAPGVPRPRRCWRRRVARRWPRPPRSPPETRPVPPADAWRPPPTPPPGRAGCCPLPPTLKPRLSRARRCRTGVSVCPGPASHTRR